MSHPIIIETQTTEDLKTQASKILDQLGLNFNTYINMALNQLVIQEGIPFEVKLNTAGRAENAGERDMALTADEKALIQKLRVSPVPEEDMKFPPLKTVDKILELMKWNPYITARELANRAGTTTSNVQYHIKHLKAEGRIERVGADKGGRWKVNEV